MHRDRHTQCCMATSPTQPKQRGYGLRSLSEHSSAAYISSLSASGVCSSSCKHLAKSIKDFNELVSSDDALVLDHLDVVMHQRSLSGKIEDHDLCVLLDKVSLPDKARLLSISSPQAVAWLSVIPSLRLNLYLEPAEFQIAVKWWLGIAVTDTPVCSFCPSYFGPFRPPCLNMQARRRCGVTAQQAQRCPLRILSTSLFGSSS